MSDIVTVLVSLGMSHSEALRVAREISGDE